MNHSTAPRLGLILLTIAAAGCTGGDSDPTGPQLSAVDCVALAPAATGYQGPFYDTHAHADLASAPAALDCLAQRHGVRTLVLFAGRTGGDNAAARVRDWMAPHAPRFVPFVHLNPQKVSDVNTAELDRALAAVPQIRGVGELATYREPWLNNSFDQAPWPELFRWAAEHQVWLMIHPRSNQIPGFEALVAAHPDTRVLLHTAWNEGEIPRLLRTYPNLYFTLDLASLISVPMPGGGVDVLLSPVSGGAAQFIQRYDAERDAILAQSYQRWAPTVLAAPDRVMWGTDAFADWHFETAVYDRMMDFARHWVALLPAELREDFAHRNAERLLGSGPRF